MSWRVHTATATFVDVELLTMDEVDRRYGYELEEGDEGEEVLVFTDTGNQEVWVSIIDGDDLRSLAQRILELAGVVPEASMAVFP